MVMHSVEEYALRSECERQAHKLTYPQSDFKVYVYDGAAYLLPVSRRANDCMRGLVTGHMDYTPMLMSAADIHMVADWVRDRIFTVEQETI